MSFIYNLVCKQTSTYVVGIFASAFVFERTFDLVADSIFESHNKGVSVSVEHITITTNSLHNNNTRFLLMSSSFSCPLAAAETVERHQAQVRIGVRPVRHGAMV